MVNWVIIKGLFLQEWFITKRSLEIFMDIIFYPAIWLVTFGFISQYLAGEGNAELARIPLLATLLWQPVWIAQYSISVGAMWNIWSRNLSNMYITPMSMREYMIALMMTGLLKSVVVFVLLSAVTATFFDFNILSLGLANLALFFINLTLFAWAAGIILLGFIFRYGTKVQALGWSTIMLFQPLAAAYFPLELLPEPIRTVSTFIPITHVFEAARGALIDNAVNVNAFVTALIMNIVFFAISIIVFKHIFKKSRETGQFVRNES